MRKLLLGLALAIGVRSAWSDCSDTTILLKSGGGFTSGNGTAASATYDPSSLNGLIRGCTAATMTVRLNIDPVESGKTKDTVKLLGPIIISGRSGRITALSMNRPSTANGALDTLFTLVDNGTNPPLLVDSINNPAIISNMAFARKVINNGGHTLDIQSKGSQVSGCHFWMADNTTDPAPGALVNLGADSVLVERCLFRAPPDGNGTSRAIRAFANIGKVEVRANVFYSTGVFFNISGPFHLIANTFAGSRNRTNAVVIGSTAPTTYNYSNAIIMHNLFAAKIDTLAPIAFSFAGPGTCDSILRNAWSRGKANLALAVNDPTGNGGTADSLRGATGANANIPLPKGFSNYGPNAGDVKDYPLTQLRTDPTLARKHPDFGKLYRVFFTGSWAGTPTPISDVSTVATRLYFPGFAPFLPGKAWLANVKVGAFVDQDDITVPSPLAAGAQGASLKLQRDTASTDKAKVTLTNFDVDYYKQTLLPEYAYFFFSNSLTKLTASNDTAALIAAGNPYVRVPWTGFDNTLAVPKEVRNGANVDIYVKMLHFRGTYMAPVLSTAAIGTLSNFPGFPVNDLVITVTGSNSLAKSANIQVTRGGEPIDSVRIVTLNDAGPVDTVSIPATGTILTKTITVTDKGRYYFQAVPVAKISGTTYKAGSPTPSTAPVDLGVTTSDTVYLAYKKAGCPTADGSSGSPFCQLDSALKVVGAKGGGTIIVRNATPPEAMVDVTIDSALAPGSGNITLTSGLFNDNRPIFLGDKKEALTVARRNVTVRGFTLEQPAGASKAALALNAGGCLVDANIFRAHAKGSVEAPAITVSVGPTAEVRIVNNVVWGFSQGIRLSGTSSPNVKILFNTFVADSSINKTPTSGVSAAGPDSVNAVIANNYFSGLTDPIDASLAGKKPVLDHNVYTAGVDLHKLSESGGLGPSTAVESANIWTATYTGTIKDALYNVVDCGPVSPCNPLYGGSSANDYGVTVATDFLGDARKNRKEVGAYEYPSAPSSVLGVLEIDPTLIQGTFRQIKFTVSGKSFDPDRDEADSVQVLWSTSDVTSNLSTVPENQRKKYPISMLVNGNITDTATGILEKTKYWFYAALSRNRGTRVMGYPYSDTVTSNPNLSYDSCTFADSKSACPSDKGVFGVNTGAWVGQFETRVTLTEPTDSGLVRVPRFASDTTAGGRNGLDLNSPLPMFLLDAAVKGLGTSSAPKQRLNWEIQFYSNLDLTGLDLYLIPDDPSGKPVLVPDWTVASLGNGKFAIRFQSTVNGPQTYAFGKLKAGTDPGILAQADPAPTPIEVNSARDSAISVPIVLKGSGFKTADPLILISAVPAGGTLNPPAGSKLPRAIAPNSPARTIVASMGFAGLDSATRASRIYDLYLKARAADSATPAPKGQKKPFVLDSLSAQDFAAAVQIDSIDPASGEVKTKMLFHKLYYDFANYPDGVGKATRSMELVLTVFEGGRISRNRGFLRAHFQADNPQQSEFYNRQLKGFFPSSNGSPHWNLFGYPWDEADSTSLARIVGKTKWDHDNMRVMAYQGVGEGAGSFVAYDGSNASSVPFDSGRAVWSGSTGYYFPATAGGLSLDYQPFKMSFTPNRYYDISLPFNFPMKWQDILDSSGLTGASVPALWRYNDTAAKWVAVQAATASPPTPGAVLYPWEGYTLKVASPATLTFPVLDTSRSTSASPKSAANDGSWAVKVEARDATAAMDLRIGRGARAMLFPEPPDVPGQDFRVALMNGEDKVSQSIQPLEGGWQGHWPLRAAAAKGSGGISLRIGEATRDVPVWLADALHATKVPLSKDQPVHVSEEDLKANDYHLVAGDAAYVDGVLQSLSPDHLLSLSNYPNPFSGATLLRYALPGGFGRTTFDLKVRDFRGRTVWEKTIETGNVLSYLWDGHDRAGVPLPAGVYSLSLTAKAEGKPAYRAVRNLLRM